MIKNKEKNIERMLFLGVLGSSLTLFLSAQFMLILRQHTVLNSETELLQKLGQHFIVGYTHFETILPLVARGAIGGIFITRRNISTSSGTILRQHIAILQHLQRASGRPPLWVATDQEGGLVSRLSPPLTHLPALATLAQYPPAQRNYRVKQYATRQGQELAQLGINVNFSPVVDLKFTHDNSFTDFHSFIAKRALSPDPKIVTQMAQVYSQSLEAQGVLATVKHFPGLGRVQTDTHYFNAPLTTQRSILEHQDWLPFRQVVQNTQAWLMLSHVQLASVDADLPCSYSESVIQGVIRHQWQHDGILVTDDFNMAPIYYGPGGIGQASVAALNAGVDLILLAYDGRQYYPAMAAVLHAYQDQQLNLLRLEASEQRLQRASTCRFSNLKQYNKNCSNR
ncbi:MAG: glycoside hydrolase family 3 N-terminal domain-containing protein [Pseudomonadota bacterium]|nr:glycoside hydrolase family 3 N-terminal domain-containing protein [Pseudomonadota bacterium]